MGLDIYAGTLTRYYTRSWKTVVQQWAEKNGYKVELISANGELRDQENRADPSEVQQGIEAWRDYILSQLSRQEEAWPEDNERPYYTDKPDWDALGALLLVAACHTYGEAAPATVRKGWAFMEDPTIDRLTKDPERIWSLFRGTTMWFPLTEDFLFQAPLPGEESAMISTTAMLGHELERINQLVWQADEAAILSWSDTEGYPMDGAMDQNGHISMENFHENTQFDTQSLAKFAFSMLWQAWRFAEENRVPIVFDY